MILHVHPNAEDFLKYNQAFLEQEEVANGLLLGRAIELRSHPEAPKKTTYFSVTKEDIPVFAGLQTPPYNFIFSPTRTAAWQLVINHLLTQPIKIPGLIGPRQLVLDAADYWGQQTGGKTEIEMRQLIYRLDQVIPVTKRPGFLRLASTADQALLVNWIKAFSRESLGQDITTAAATKVFKQRVEQRYLYVWEAEDGVLLTMAAVSRPTPNGICINYVYTPPANRKQGLASVCVAALSQLMLDRGFAFCTLFTDEDFPTSNRIYKRMGYREETTFASIRFK